MSESSFSSIVLHRIHSQNYCPLFRLPAITETKEETPTVIETETTTETKTENVTLDLNKPYEEMTIEELQEAILEKMRKNGPVTDYMLGTVRENVYHDSLINWVKSF
jgi:hypothetical protein